MLMRRRAMMQSIAGAAPDVTFVRALIGHGSEYINAGIDTVDVGSNDFEIYFKGTIPKLRNTDILFGTGSGSRIQIAVMSTGAVLTDVVKITTAGEISANTEFELLLNADGAFLDGTSITSRARTYSQACTYPFILFGKSTSATAVETATVAKAYCAAFHYYYGGTMIRNFLPALDADSVPCMYDTITKQCYYNAGSGAFGYVDNDGNIH